MSIFVINGSGLSDDEVNLGTPDVTEAKDLEHHVARCAMRYRMFTRRQATQGQDITQIKYMVLGLIGVILITSPQVRDIFEWAHKIF